MEPEPIATEQQLRLLTIFHYIVGGFAALFGCFPLIHFTLGLMMVFWPHVLAPKAPQQAPPEMLGWFFMLLGGGMFLSFQGLAWCIIVAGRFLSRRKHYMFVFVVACCECMFMPFGTVLGVFTIIALSKPAVKALFYSSSAGESATP